MTLKFADVKEVLREGLSSSCKTAEAAAAGVKLALLVRGRKVASLLRRSIGA